MGSRINLLWLVISIIGLLFSSTFCASIGEDQNDSNDNAQATKASEESGASEENTASEESEENAETSLPLVRINEISSSADDPIELVNLGAEEADISDWILTDELGPEPGELPYNSILDEKELHFPSGTTIVAGGFLVVRKGESEGLHPFGLKSEGETLSLLDRAGNVVDQVTYGDNDAENSFCRLDDAWSRCEPTWGSDNIAALCGNGLLDPGERCDGQEGLATCGELEGFREEGALGCHEDCLRYDTTGCIADSLPLCEEGVRLNEVCHKESKCGIKDLTDGDWLELHNETNNAIEIAGCYLRIIDDDETVRLGPVQLASVSGYEFTTIPPQGFLVIDDNEALIDAGKNNRVELLREAGSTELVLINSLITSSAHNDASDPCTITEEGDTPTPGTANICASNTPP